MSFCVGHSAFRIQKPTRACRCLHLPTSSAEHIGALALDVGSGEMKLYALLLQPDVEVHELKLVKHKASEAASRLAAGDSEMMEDICAQLEEGLEGLPALVSKRTVPVHLEHAVVGAEDPVEEVADRAAEDRAQLSGVPRRNSVLGAFDPSPVWSLRLGQAPSPPP